MLLCFILNIFAVLVITQQYYQIHRIQTAGALGFDMAKSYYLNENILKLRHAAVQGFFAGLPIYVLAVGVSAFGKMEGDKPYTARGILGALCFSALVLFLVIRTQRMVFHDHH